LKIRLLAERAGLASISSENNQFALRYPDNEIPDGLPDLGPVVRLGKTAIWFPYTNLPDWQDELMDLLKRLKVTG